MKVFIIYTIFIIITVFIYILTFRYKKQKFKLLDAHSYKFKSFFGISAFIIDFIDMHIHKINYEEIKSKLSRINIRKADETEAYFYMVSKTAISIFVFIIIEMAGYIKCVNNTFCEDERVLSIVRPEYGEGEKEYNLIFGYDNGKRENIEIVLSERKYTKDEVMQMFTDSYNELMAKFLGNNKELENITDNLCLITELKNGISVDWSIKDSDYIDYSGNIRWENIKNNKETEVEALLSFNDYSQSYSIPLVINKDGRKDELLVKDEISNWIEKAPEEERKIKLPEFIKGVNIQFFREQDSGTLIYIFTGVLAAVIIYAAKEKETDKKLNNRKRQLETDYASIVSKLTILQSSGMSILAAWDKIIEDYEKSISRKKNGRRKNTKDEVRFAYEEMKYARNRMKTGYSEISSYIEFGRRCGIHSYIKFANLLEQNIKKGTKGLKIILEAEVREALEERKALARKKGDEAGTKLLLPMGIMLIISIIVIMVPAFLAMNM